MLETPKRYQSPQCMLQIQSQIQGHLGSFWEVTNSTNFQKTEVDRGLLKLAKLMLHPGKLT